MFKEALKCSDKALEKDASYTPALINRGTVLAQPGRLKETIDCINKVIGNPKEKPNE